MDAAIQLFTQWEQLTPEARTFFAGLVEGWNRAPKEATAAAPAKPRKPRKTRGAGDRAAADARAATATA